MFHNVPYANDCYAAKMDRAQSVSLRQECNETCNEMTNGVQRNAAQA